ncbi:MAG TPA: thiamine pyrophosphate-dependent enzyme [Vicinamibacterales bacterium]|nr:thiamine pyrophosphate-dependent enzyme [Vicinamibacterales bacterium]
MSLRARFLTFIAEQQPFAGALAAAAWDKAVKREPETADDVEHLRVPLARAIRAAIAWPKLPAGTETTPGVTARERFDRAEESLADIADGFLRRVAIERGLTAEERREILRGMILTRAVDNRLKAFFNGSEVRYENTPFQGKGFRSLGQEAIYAAAIRLKRGPEFRTDDGEWQGDVVGPIIRDLGAALAMRPKPETVRMVLNGQMAKAGPPMDGRDLHIGDFSWGVLPAAAPLSISSLTVAGMGLAFERLGHTRVAVSFIGEGGSSLGEWHEAINLCAAKRLPVIFCLENNQTALSTPVRDNSAARMFADKAAGYGIPGITLDGTDPDAIAAAFTWAAERARAGAGATLIELVAMRMCGHAHHDDMLYLGKDPQPSWTYPPVTPQGYADPELYEFWRVRDPIPTYARKLEAMGVIGADDLRLFKDAAEALVEEQARAVVAAPWPDPAMVTRGVIANDPVARARVEILERRGDAPADVELPAVEDAPPFDKKGMTFLEAVMHGVGDALDADPRAFVFGEDVGGKYGNAFLLLRPLLEKHGDRILNSPLAEGAVLGACIGSALAGLRPIGEMQFNDFVATGFNQLVNNAAKIRYRWGVDVPMVVRMPWGGLRHAGPYHSQNTEPWFYRTPGLKIAVPSTPHDARALMASAVADPDPVLYYEHIALYRDPRIKQRVAAGAPSALPVGKAALRRAGDDLAIISYGAYVHAAMRVAERLAASGIEASVLDLRWLSPLDRASVLAVAKHTGRVLIVHEDSRTGGIGESVAAIVQEEAFEWLDAPVRIMGALDTPVPYSPPLEEAFLPSEADIEKAARLLVAY